MQKAKTLHRTATLIIERSGRPNSFPVVPITLFPAWYKSGNLLYTAMNSVVVEERGEGEEPYTLLDEYKAKAGTPSRQPSVKLFVSVTDQLPNDFITQTGEEFDEFLEELDDSDEPHQESTALDA